MIREGYLVNGRYRHSECVAGEVHTGDYLPGGYFYRPPGTINGGPEAAATSESIWLLREPAMLKFAPVLVTPGRMSTTSWKLRLSTGRLSNCS